MTWTIVTDVDRDYYLVIDGLLVKVDGRVFYDSLLELVEAFNGENALIADDAKIIANGENVEEIIHLKSTNPELFL